MRFFLQQKKTFTELQKTTGVHKFPFQKMQFYFKHNSGAKARNILHCNLIKVIERRDFMAKKLPTKFPLISLSDNISKALFQLKENEQGKFGKEIVENEKFNFKTILKVEPFENEPLDVFDQQIFQLALSYQDAGFTSATLAQIYRDLGGDGKHLTKARKEKILHSVTKLSRSFITITIQKEYIDANKFETNKKFVPVKNKQGKDFLQCRGYLLPCEITVGKVNGKDVDLVRFLGESPLFSVAEMKKQLSKLDANLIRVPNLRAETTAVKLKCVLLARINDCKRSWQPNKKTFGRGKGKKIVDVSNKLCKKLTFEKIFSLCDLSANKKHNDRYRATIEKILNHFQDLGFISEWNFEKVGHEFYALTFDFVQGGY